MKNLVLRTVAIVFSRCRRGVQKLSRSDSASSTPEYAIIVFLIAAIMIPTVVPLGLRIADSLRPLNQSTPDAYEIAQRPDVSVTTESADLSPFEGFLFEPGIRLQLMAILVTSVWLWWRYRSRKARKKPQQLEDDSQETESERIFDKRQQILRIITNNMDDFRRGLLQVWHLSPMNPVTIGPNESVDNACKIMDASMFNHLLVCEPDRTLIGLVSRHYLRRTNHKKVGDAMVREPLFVSPNAMLNTTITAMLNKGVSCVAVVEDGKAVGILTTTDVQMMLQVALQSLAQMTNDACSLEC